MSDNLTRYCAIRARLMQRQDATLNGHQQRNLHTFAQRVRGSVGSRKCPLPARASKVPCLTDTCLTCNPYGLRYTLSTPRDDGVLRGRRAFNNAVETPDYAMAP